MIYKSGKKGTYYLRYKVDGKDNRIRLLDTAGNPVKTKADAEASSKRILAHVREKDRAEQLRTLKRDLQDAEEAAKAAEMEMKNTAALVNKGWELYMSCHSRMKCCKRYTVSTVPPYTTAAMYRSYYSRFSGWMKERHPEIYQIADVTQDIAEEFAVELQKIFAPGTVNKYRTFMLSFFETLQKDGKISMSRNPFSTVERMEAETNTRRELTIPELQKIIETAEGDLKLLLQVGTFTGLRLGDCCTLSWGEIDMARGIIKRKPRKTARKTGTVVTLGIPTPLYAALEEIPDTERTGYLLPRLAKAYLAPHGNGNITRMIQRHIRKCGIELYAPGTGAKYHYEGKKKISDHAPRAVLQVGFHSLRHTWVSLHAMSGTPQAVIQQAAGHSNPAMTEHYTHVSDDAARIAAHALEIPQLCGETIDAVPIQSGEREKLREIAKTWEIEKLKKILEYANSLR